MFYLALIAGSFRKSSLEELSKIAEFSVIDEFVSTLIIESKEKEFPEKLLRSRPTFIYNLLPLEGRSEIREDEYLESLRLAMAKLPNKGSVKVECFDVNCKTEYSAKDIEVYLGRRLEKDEYDVNIINPDVLAYLVLINGSCYFGSADYKKMRKKFVNPERYYHQYSKSSVSRSELKLIQAFDEFAIEAKGTALDIGAAPGGWSNFLARSGFSVVAVDNGALDYKRFEESGIGVKVAGGSPSKKELKPGQVMHVRSNAREVDLKGIGKVDLVADDMNMDPRDSAEILLSFSNSFKKGAKLVMTVKCIDRKAEKHLEHAREALRGSFSLLGARVLPSNRQELTLYAEYTGRTP